MKRISYFSTTLLLMALLAACTVPVAPAEGTGSASTEAADEATGEAAGEAANEAVVADGECEEGFRYFDHELLATEPTCVPENPQRVTYLLYPSYIYSFGINPVGSWGLERDAENYPFIADWIMEGTIDHGMPPELETLLGLQPDLLLYDITRVTEVIEELPQIAPLVTFDAAKATSWQERHRFNGEVFGQLDLANAQIAEFEQRVAELRAGIEDSQGDVSDITVSVVRLRGEGQISLLSTWFTSVSIIQEVGFDLPDLVDMSLDEMQAIYDSVYNAPISEELIPSVDGDILIVLGSPGSAEAQSIEGDAIVADMLQDPLWQTLNALQTDSVYPKGDYWLQSNLLTAHLVIDELAEIFEVELETTNPFLGE